MIKSVLGGKSIYCGTNSMKELWWRDYSCLYGMSTAGRYWMNSLSPEKVYRLTPIRTFKTNVWVLCLIFCHDMRIRTFLFDNTCGINIINVSVFFH
jgi:hypothetical protein